jgi:hypothetical protein
MLLPVREIARISTDEIIAAMAATDAPWWLRRFVGAAVQLPSWRLARRLARFDAAIARDGLARAAKAFLETMGATVTVYGSPPTRAALVVMNHPGAYDALALMAALGRDDVRFLARDRRFLRVLPNLSSRMIFVSASGLRQALRFLRGGGAVVQLGAGRIEREDTLADWPDGTGFLAARAPMVVPAFVRGVHSPRAQRLPLVRWAESRGVTTVGPLIQATLPGFRDVHLTLRFGSPVPLDRTQPRATRTAAVRAAVQSLAHQS